MAKKRLSPKYQDWIDARKRFHLTHAHIQMARELGMNPRKLGKLANYRQEPWKVPLPAYIEELYFKRFHKLHRKTSARSNRSSAIRNRNRLIAKPRSSELRGHGALFSASGFPQQSAPAWIGGHRFGKRLPATGLSRIVGDWTLQTPISRKASDENATCRLRGSIVSLQFLAPGPELSPDL